MLSWQVMSYRALGAFNPAGMPSISLRLHWIDQPHRSHEKDGEEVRIVSCPTQVMHNETLELVGTIASMIRSP